MSKRDSRNPKMQYAQELRTIETDMEHIIQQLSCTPHGHPIISPLLSGLGQSHSARFDLLGELDDIDRAIEYTTMSLNLAPGDDPHFPDISSDLGANHISRFKRLGELRDFEKAIEYGSLALALTPDGHPRLPIRHTNLGAYYGYRFDRLGELGDLEKGIECHSRAVALTPNGHPSLPAQLLNLGVSLKHRFQRLGEIDDIDKAIECHSRAVALTPDGHTDSIILLSNLGISLKSRFERLGELRDIEKAIECQSHALALTPDGHPHLSNQLANLGVSYSHRFLRLGELGDLEKAIEYQSRAVTEAPDGHPDLPNQLDNLGVSHRYRFEHLGELCDLEKSIECHSRGLALTPHDHPTLSRRLANLGVSHTRRFEHLDEPGDFEKAIEYHSHALALTPDDHPHLPSMLANLGVAHSHRFLHQGQQGDIEKVIECMTCALELTPEGHPNLPNFQFPLAEFRLHQYHRTDDQSHLQDSLVSFRMASQSLAGPPRVRFMYANGWAMRASQESYLQCLEAYQTVIDLLPQFIWLGATTTQRYQDLVQAKSLAARAAHAAIRSSKFDLALEWLEHARCVVWNQNLMLRSPIDQLHSFDPVLAARLQTVAARLHHAGSNPHDFQALSSGLLTPEEAAQHHRQLAEEYNNLIAQIRTLPGFQDFLQPMKANALVRAARNGPIVVINCHEDCCDALVIMPGQDQVKRIALPKFTGKKAHLTRMEMQISVRSNGLTERAVERRPVLEDRVEFQKILAQLWYDLVKPILDSLGYTNKDSNDNLPHITWCPTGALSFLPLHAAGDYDKPRARVFEYVISSYTPTLSALLSSTPSSLTPNSRVLAIGQPATPGHSPLPGTTEELAYLKGHTSGKVRYSELIGLQATTTTVLGALEDHDWVHLACHAHQNVQDPTKSGFFLHDDALDLTSINRQLLKNKGLAYLSACQTATGDEQLPDEAIHLASGMLMAGYSSVIATMWSVHDDDAPFVADKVYGHLMKEGKLGKGEAGKALHYAVTELRKNVRETEFRRWVPYVHIGS